MDRSSSERVRPRSAARRPSVADVVASGAPGPALERNDDSEQVDETTHSPVISSEAATRLRSRQLTDRLMRKKRLRTAVMRYAERLVGASIGREEKRMASSLSTSVMQVSHSQRGMCVLRA